MRYVMHAVSMLPLLPVAASAVIPTSQTIEVYSPVDYEWTDGVNNMIAAMSPAEDLGYAVTVTRVPPMYASSEDSVTTVPAQFFESLMGSGRGVFHKSSRHGYGQPAGLVIGVWESKNNRDTSLALMNSTLGGGYTAFDGAQGVWWGVIASNTKLSSTYVDANSLIVIDDCDGFGVITGGFANAKAGVGYDGTCTIDESLADITELYESLGNYTPLFLAASSIADISYTPPASTFKLANNPAAEFFGARVEENMLRFGAVPFETERWSLQSADSPEGPFVEFAVAEVQSTSVLNEVPISSGRSWLRVVEVEEDGEEIIQAIVRNASAKVTPELFRHLDEAGLRAELNAMESRRSTTLQRSTSNEMLLTFAPSAWAVETEAHFNSYWRNKRGLTSALVEVSYGTSALSIHNTIKSYYQSAVAQGQVLSVHFMGGSSDAEMWNNPSSWPSNWQAKKQSYDDAGYAPVSGRNLIPSWYIPDGERNPDDSTGWWVPWMPTDMPYQDMNDDGTPDIVVTRWPLRPGSDALSHLLARCITMQNYNDNGHAVPGQYYDVEVWSGELPGEPGDTQRVMNLRDLIVAELPALPSFLTESTQPDPGQRNLLAQSRLNAGMDLLIMLANKSNPYHPGKYLYSAGAEPRFVAEMLNPNSQTPYVISLVCGSAGWGRTQHPDQYDPTIVELGKLENRGPIAWLASRGGTWHPENVRITRQAVADLFDPANSGLSLAARWLRSTQSLTAEFGESYGFDLTLAGASFVGDPYSPLLTLGDVTSVSDGTPVPMSLAQNFPNPFNPSTSISFSLSANGRVELNVFDLRGRLVRTLLAEELPAGQHAVTWNGRDSAGRAVASGVYFYSLKAGGESYSRKMTLLK